jgi:Tfp pilus assembly protein PilP
MRSLEVLALGFMIAAAPAMQAQSTPSSAAPAKPAPAKAAATTPAKPAPQSAKPATASAPASKPQSAQTPASKPRAAKPQNPAPKAQVAKPQTAAPKPQGAAPAAKPPAKPAAAKPAAKPVKKAAPKKKVEQPASTQTASANAPEGEAAKGARRDPFESLVSRQQNAANAAKLLPPGKAGLQVSTLRLDGIVKAPNGMIAVVTNPQARTYFLREGDQLYDGRVEKIAMDGVSFHEVGKDAFGKPVERQVNKRIYSSTPGEQQ